MTLYTRPKNEVFASDSPPSEIKPFDAWAYGLGIAFIETGGFPELESMNGLFNALNQYIKYLEQNGFAEWSASLEYPVGAGVRVGSIWYRARTRNTNKPPSTSQNDWAVFLNGADIASASTTVKGIVQLSNVLNSTSTSLALTAAQGKVLQDNKLDKSGGMMTGDLIISTNGTIVNLGAANTNSIRSRGIQGIKTDNSAPDGLYLNQEGGPVYFGINLYSISEDGNFSGNAASASNVSRSIVAGNGLTGGGELNANRTITLGTPSTVTASTANSTTGTSHTHNLDVNSLPLLGVGQTWQKPSRSIGTTYTNNTGRPIQVFICANLDVGSFDISGVKMDIIDGDTYCFVNCIIPAGATYSLRSIYGGASIVSWAELR